MMICYEETSREYLLKVIANSRHGDILERCIELYYEGFELCDQDRISEAHSKLSELVAMGDPIAIILSGSFGRKEEGEREFLARHIACLRQAALLKEPIALHALGIHFDLGNSDFDIDVNKELAREYFREAAELGMPKSMGYYGVMLYYGTGGVKQDIDRGLTYLRAAANAGDEYAEYRLNEILANWPCQEKE